MTSYRDIDLSLWAVHEGYFVRDGVVQPRGRHRKWYSPGDDRSIVTEFAKIRDERGVLAFVRHYGMLAQLPASAHLNNVDTILKEAAATRFALEVLMRIDDPVALGAYMAKVIRHDQRRGMYVDAGAEAFAVVDDVDAEAAQEMVAELVNHRIAGVHHRLAVDVRGQRDFRGRMVIDSLLAAIWWHVFRMARDRAKFVLCELCSALVERRDARQRFCAGRPGEESACATRARQRRHREGKGRQDE
ncbi:MAG TPA: hypothetical protein VI789_01135 [Dehalococcoidia bacterium]|nr:hypothetical protein [Dehalococcoidia bacterium]